MKNLTALSNDGLIQETQRLVREELRIGLDVLTHLRELDRRRMWLERGHASLFSFCTRELGYSEPQAQLRIDAMRALRDTPAIEEKVKTGSLNVTAVVQVQRFLRKEKTVLGKTYTPEARVELFERVAGKSSREVEQELVKLSPGSARPEERTRVLTEQESEIRLVVPEDLLKQLESLKALYSHRMKNVNSTVELLKLLANDALSRAERRTGTRSSIPFQKEELERSAATNSDKIVATIALKVNAETPTRTVPAAIRRAVWQRDQGRCGYTDPKTQIRCDSRAYLQIDHITPFSAGGSSSDASQLRLRCGAHNRLHWRRWKERAALSNSSTGVEGRNPGRGAGSIWP